MKEEELKNHIDFERIGVLTEVNQLSERVSNKDYLMDDKGNYIYPLNPVEFKLIEEIKKLEARIIELEKTKVIV